MHDREARIVLNRLSEYGCYKELAEEAERMALWTQVAIDNCGMQSSPKDKIASTVSAGSSDSRMLELIGEQKMYEADAKYYRERMNSIETYISLFEVDVSKIMVEHFIKGRTYDDMEEFYFSSEGLIRKVGRAIVASDYADAADII